MSPSTILIARIALGLTCAAAAGEEGTRTGGGVNLTPTLWSAPCWTHTPTIYVRNVGLAWRKEGAHERDTRRRGLPARPGLAARNLGPVVATEPQAPPAGAARGPGHSHGDQESRHGDRKIGAGSGGAPVTHSRRATAVAWFAVAVLALAAAALTVLAAGPLNTSDTISNFATAPAAVLYATLGALVVRRAGNVIGWFVLGVGAGTAVMGSASAYAVLGIAHAGTLPAPELMAVLAEWSFVPVFTAIIFMLLLFPSGTLPSPRWRPFAALTVLATALALIGFVVHPRLIGLPAPGGSLMVANPLGIDSLGPLLSTVLIGTLNSWGVVTTALLAAATVSLAVRYGSGGREVRKQIKWIMVAAVVLTVGQLAALLGIAATGTESNPVTTVAFAVVPIVALLGIP